jgi:hypothetical protein
MWNRDFAIRGDYQEQGTRSSDEASRSGEAQRKWGYTTHVTIRPSHDTEKLDVYNLISPYSACHGRRLFVVALQFFSS